MLIHYTIQATHYQPSEDNEAFSPAYLVIQVLPW